MKKRFLKLTLSAITVLLLTGCVSNIQKERNLDIEKNETGFQMMKLPDEIIKKKKSINLHQNLKLSQALKQLENIESHIYILDKDSIDIDIYPSNYKGISNFKALKKYINDTSKGLYDIEIKNKYLDKQYSIIYAFDKYEKNKAGLEHVEYTFHFKDKVPLSNVFNLIENHTGFNIVPTDNFIAKRYDENIVSSYMGTNIKGFLDYLSRSNNFYYDIDYVKKQIKIYQYKMKTFELAYQNENVDIESNINISSSTTTSENTTDSVKFKSKQNPFTNLQLSLASIFGRDVTIDGEGKVKKQSFNKPNNTENFYIENHEDYIINDSAGNIIVTASPNIFEKAEEAIKNFNDLYGKNVIIDINVYKVTYEDNNQYGTNFSILSKLASNEGLSANFIGSRGEAANATLNNLNSLNFVEVSTDRDFSAVLQSLHQYGNSHLANTFSVITQNNVLGIDFSRTQKKYVDKVESDTTEATATTGEKTEYNANQEDLQYGDLLLVTPRVVAGNKIQLNMYLKFNTLVSMQERSFGDEASNLFLQQPEIDDSIKKINLTIGEGERYLVSAKIKSLQNKNYGGLIPTSNGLIQSVTGNNDRTQSREEYIVMVTAKIK